MQKQYFLGLSEEGFHRVNYLEWGTPNNTDVPIVCVHGFSRHAHDFDSLAEYFAYRGCHLYCPDIVGRGDSDWLKNSLHYTYEQYVADMNNMIARTKAQQIDWIGTSMGGIIGMFLAAQENSPIRKLVINDIGAQIPVKALSRLSKYMARDPHFTSVDMAKKYFKKSYSDFGMLTEDQWDDFTKHSIREVEPGKFGSKVDHNVKRTPAKSKMAWKLLMNPHKALEGTFFDIDLWYLWRKISVPVLIVHGENSDMLTPKIIEKMQAVHPKTDLITIKNAGHAPALLNADEQEKIYHWLMRK